MQVRLKKKGGEDMMTFFIILFGILVERALSADLIVTGNTTLPLLKGDTRTMGFDSRYNKNVTW